ncbi:hypothetical protein SDC9_189244 [bioreactor metagenome]|uniref:Uncharacterized protein n=1 Tax=bioreactor metagenome TaxID=1076179 RepID=A0A645HU23_9ZZZZ
MIQSSFFFSNNPINDSNKIINIRWSEVVITKLRVKGFLLKTLDNAVQGIYFRETITTKRLIYPQNCPWNFTFFNQFFCPSFCLPIPLNWLSRIIFAVRLCFFPVKNIGRRNMDKTFSRFLTGFKDVFGSFDIHLITTSCFISILLPSCCDIRKSCKVN